jgi:hypothetical protein
MERDYIINFILLHNRNLTMEELELLSIGSLVMIKLQIELELINVKIN